MDDDTDEGRSVAARLATVVGLLWALAICAVFLVPERMVLGLAPWWMVFIPIFVAERNVIDEWLGVPADRAINGRGYGVFIFLAAGMIGTFLRFLGEHASLKDLKVPSRDELIFLVGMVGLIGYVFLVSKIYDWRRMRRGNNDRNGREGDIERISLLGGLHHVAGYLVGFAAATAAAIRVDPMSARFAVFVAVFLGGKLLMDTTAPHYRDVGRQGMTQALMRMAVVSPLWWGLPWALVLGGGSVVVVVHDSVTGPAYLMWLVETALLPFLVVVAAGYCGIALVALVADLLGGKLSSVSDDEPESWSRGDWGRAFFCMTVTVGIAASFLIVPLSPFGADLYGTETWTCAEEDGAFAIGWIPRAGVHIIVHDTRVELFDASCVPRSDGQGCDYDDAGWERLVFDFVAPDGNDEISFTRGQVDVPTGYRHHADLLVEAAFEVVTRMQRSHSFTLHIIAPKARELYALHVDLAGFNKAYGVCAAHWREQARQAQR